MLACRHLNVCFNFSFLINSKPIIPLDEGGEVTGSIVRSYVTVERPTGGKQIRKAKQHTPGRTAARLMMRFFAISNRRMAAQTAQ